MTAIAATMLLFLALVGAACRVVRQITTETPTARGERDWRP